MALTRPSVSQTASRKDTRVIEFGSVTVTAVRTASLGNWTYLIASDGDSVVVDPQRDAERFVGIAERSETRLRHVIETHIHSDYLSGGLWLAGQTGAEVIAARRGGYQFDHRPVDDGDELTIGAMTLRCLAMPGHTFEHVSWQLLDTDSGELLAILSGGSLLRSGAGRTDLSGDDSTAELTRLQFDSMRRLSAMAADSLLLPTHDGGSTCSIGIVSPDGVPWWDLPSEPDEFPTIKAARDANRYLELPDSEEFAADFLSDRGPAPAYFVHVARQNREGVPVATRPRTVTRLSAAEFARLTRTGAWVVDARNRWMFADGHVPGSLNIEPNDAFAVHVGSLVPFGTAVAVIVEDRDEAMVDDLATSLFRIGYELSATLEGGIDAWLEAGYPTASYPSADMMEIVAEASHGGHPKILDVREPSEWRNGVVPGSQTISVSGLGEAAAGMRQSWSHAGGDRLTVTCHGGARAAVAASYLARHDIPVRAILGGGVPDAMRVPGFVSAPPQ